MPLICASKDNQLSKTPDTQKDLQNKMPFALNGAPMTTRPQSLSNLSTYRIKNGSDYVLDNLLSENIIGADSNTTLRYEIQRYTQKFIAIHSAIWGEEGTAMSIFFTADNDDMFHIYIPLTLTNNDSENENKFLKAWTNSSYTLPTPFSVNRLLEFFNTTIVEFRISDFCLKFNSNKKINHYTLCKFNNPHILNVQPASNWLVASGLITTSDPTGDSVGSYRRTTFNAVLNFMLNGTIVNQSNSNLISDVDHIATSSTYYSTINPIFYRVKKDELFTTSRSYETDVKGLQNIKCYPLDLASQVDDNGNIFIDQTTKKPIQVKNINKSNIAAGESLPPEQLALQQKETTDFITFWAAFGVIIFILILAVFAVVLYIYRQMANVPAVDDSAS